MKVVEKFFHDFTEYLRLLRLSHVLKNILIFLPLFFSKMVFNVHLLLAAVIAFLSFSFAAQSVYVLNDICDINNDRQHPQKCHRPIASGAVPVPIAVFLCSALILVSIGLDILFSMSRKSLIVIILYLILNIGYSIKWKNVAVLDISILASGFLLRVLYGGLFCGISISPWLFLCVLSIALYMGIGKRYGELKKFGNSIETRPVLKFYSTDFLEKNMYLSAGIGIVFYSLWTFFSGIGPLAMWTIPFVVIAFFRYSFILDMKKSDGNPVSLILADVPLLLLGGLVIFLLSIQLYGKVLYECIRF